MKYSVKWLKKSASFSNRSIAMLSRLHTSSQDSGIWGPVLQTFSSSPNLRKLHDGGPHMKCSMPLISVLVQLD